MDDEYYGEEDEEVWANPHVNPKEISTSGRTFLIGVLIVLVSLVGGYKAWQKWGWYAHDFMSVEKIEIVVPVRVENTPNKFRWTKFYVDEKGYLRKEK